MREEPQKVTITIECDIVIARKTARDTAKELGFGVTDVTRIVTAASELARNIYRFAGTGVMHCCTVKNGDTAGIELIFQDNGPGIPDIDKAMEVGYTTGGGLGMGLPGARRLMDEMELSSEAGKGTTVTVRKWLRGI
jgi:serine/threonine-protein kinase RsbT